MPASKAQQRAVAKYMAANYDEMKIRVPKGRKGTVEALAVARGESVNAMVNALLRGAAVLTEAEWKERPEE